MFRSPLPLVLALLVAAISGASGAALTPAPVNAVSVDGSQLLSASISVTTGTGSTAVTTTTIYGQNRLVPGTVTGFAGVGAASVLVGGGTPAPATGSRGALTADWFLDTGIINASNATGAMTVTFPQPIVNQTGYDIVVFQANPGASGLGYTVTINGVSATIAATDAPNITSTGYAITSADTYNTRNAANTADVTTSTVSLLENSLLNLSNSDFNASIFGAALDLTQFGVADGASVTSMTIASVGTSTATDVDIVMVAGIIIPPEQTGGPVIEELMASNSSILQDEDLIYPDWVEIYNGTGTAASLAGWTLSDDPATPGKWTFPSITLQPYGYTYVFCSGVSKFTGAHPHSSLKLSKSGGTVVLTRPNGTTASSITYPAQVTDISYGALGASQTLGFLETPTPGNANGGRQALNPPCADPVFDKVSGVITSATSLSMVLPTGAPSGAVIRYVAADAVPTESSNIYSTTLPISASATYSARVFAPNYLPSRTSHRSFMWYNADMVSNFNATGAPFTSNLPIIVLDSYGVNIDGTTSPTYLRPGRFSQVAVYDVDATSGRSSLAATPTMLVRAGLHVRGQSSSGFAEHPYAMEFWGDYIDDDTKYSLLGMPSESDWVLQTLYTDKTFMRNYTMQQLMLLENGSYAGRRCRYVEVFFNQDNNTCSYGTGTSGDYRGVYLLMEDIKRGSDRVAVQKLNTEMTDPTTITGGFIFAKDKTPYDNPFMTASVTGEAWSNLTLDIKDPSDVTAAQIASLKSYLDQTNTAFAQTTFATPSSTNYYGNWIDVHSYIDKQIWQETCKEVDGYTFSYYFSKDRGGKVSSFPFWDVDRSLGNANYGASDNAFGWHFWSSTAGYTYYPKLFTDPEFSQGYWDRWYKLRQTSFSTANLMARIEAAAAQLTTNTSGVVLDASTITNTSATTSAATQCPASRHFKRWVTLGLNSYSSGPTGQTDRTTYRNELDLMKSYLTYRLDWMDNMAQNNLRPPDLVDNSTGATRFGGAVSSTYSTAIVNPNETTGTLYYTINGADPRVSLTAASGQIISGGTRPYTSLFASGTSWKYFTQGSQPATTWINTAFDDSGSAWTSATGPIGYSQTSLGTTLPQVTTTMYFRKSFSVTSAATVTGLNLELQVVDGAVVYLNGAEVARTGMTYPPTAIAFASLATGQVVSLGQQIYNFIRIDPTKLVEGTNVLAVEVHQVGNSGTAMRLDARLKALRAPSLGTPISFSGGGGAYTVRTRLLTSAGLWSPLTESTFVVNAAPASLANVVISELHYHPTDPGTTETNAGYKQKDFEFIELLNVGTGTVDLAGAQFTAGVFYTFPTNSPTTTVLAPGGRVVVASNVSAFRMRYPNLSAVTVLGPYTDNLSNSGETVTLVSSTGATIASFAYSTIEPWPMDADGGGYSLVLNNPTANLTSAYYNTGANWRTSATAGGLPGQAKAAAFTGSTSGDTDGDGIPDKLEYALGSSYTNAASRSLPVVSVAPFTVAGVTKNYVAIQYKRNLSADGVTLVAEFSTDMSTWASDTGSLTYVSRHNNGDGTETLTYRSTKPADSSLPQGFMRVRVQ